MPVAVAATNVRAPRASALLAAFQTARGTVVADFSTSGTTELWDTRPKILLDAPKSRNRNWTFNSEAPETAESVYLGVRPSGTIEMHATEKSLEWLLRSNWGPFSGGTFALKAQINEWLTLGWLESTTNANGRLARVRDAWFHNVKLVVRPPYGICTLIGKFSGEAILGEALPVSGVTLPASFAPATIKNVFPVAGLTWRRDPASLNVSLRLNYLELELEQGVVRDWSDFDQSFPVYKAGRAEVTVAFRSCVSDETWAVIDDHLAGTKRNFRLTASAISPAKTFQVDLYDVQVEEPVELGRDGRGRVDFMATGRAHVVSGNFVTLSLT